MENAIEIYKDKAGYWLCIYDNKGFTYIPTASGINTKFWKTEKGVMRYIDKYDTDKTLKVIKKYN